MAAPNAEDELITAMGSAVVTLLVLTTLVLIWFIIKCLETVVQAFICYPDCRPLWIALGVCAVIAVVTLLFGAEYPLLINLWLISALTLVLVAKIALIYHDTLFQRELDQQTLTQRVLHEPWWNTQPSNQAVHGQMAA